MKKFFTGAAGFLGGYLIDSFLESEARITAVDIAEPNRQFEQVCHDRAKGVQADKTAGGFDRQNILKTAKEKFHWRKVSQRVLSVLQNTEPALERWLLEDSELSK